MTYKIKDSGLMAFFFGLKFSYIRFLCVGEEHVFEMKPFLPWSFRCPTNPFHTVLLSKTRRINMLFISLFSLIINLAEVGFRSWRGVEKQGQEKF